MEQLRRAWSGRPEDAEHRSTVLRGMRAQSMEFSELNVEYGYSYESAAVVSDGTPAPDLLDDIRVYQPSTRPGSPLPHAWIDDEDGNRRPIKDLVAPGRFLLIAGEDGEAWCEAARRSPRRRACPSTRCASATSTATSTTRAAPGCASARSQSDGAILVRPDRFIAWRAPTAATSPGRARRARSARSSPSVATRPRTGPVLGGHVMTAQGLDPRRRDCRLRAGGTGAGGAASRASWSARPRGTLRRRRRRRLPAHRRRGRPARNALPPAAEAARHPRREGRVAGSGCAPRRARPRRAPHCVARGAQRPRRARPPRFLRVRRRRLGAGGAALLDDLRTQLNITLTPATSGALA